MDIARYLPIWEDALSPQQIRELQDVVAEHTTQSSVIDGSSAINADGVWVFNGTATGFRFPAGVFTDITVAEAWIAHHHLSGTLTWYPLDIGAYDWAVAR